jgi:hypothetical protein
LNELAKRRFFLIEKGSGTRMTGDQFFSKKKFRPDIGLSSEAISYGLRLANYSPSE